MAVNNSELFVYHQLVCLGAKPFLAHEQSSHEGGEGSLNVYGHSSSQALHCQEKGVLYHEYAWS